MPSVVLDLRCAVRSIRGAWASALGAVLVIALGVGILASAFALADPFILRPLPFPRPDRLVLLSFEPRRDADLRGTANRLPRMAEWQSRPGLISGACAIRRGAVLRVAHPGGARALQTAEVSAQCLDVLGIGVTLDDDWTARSADVRLAVTERGARVLEGADGAPLGSLPLQGGGSVRVVAALPRSFIVPLDDAIRVDALMPVEVDELLEVERSLDGLAVATMAFDVILRLRDGVEIEGLRSAIAVANSASPYDARVRPLSEHLTARQRPLALGAVAASALILLIAAGNVATLLLTRMAQRSDELATRWKLGASRIDLTRRVLVEVAVLAGTGCAASLLVAAISLKLTALVVPLEYVTLGQPKLTMRVVVVALSGAAIVLAAGAVTAWFGTRLARHTGRDSHAVIGVSSHVRAFRWLLLSAQAALCMLLACGAGLLAHSSLLMGRQDTGFSGAVFAVSTSYPADRTGANLEDDISATLARLRRLPGVLSAAASFGPLVERSTTLAVLRIDGRIFPVAPRHVSGDFFRASGMQIVAGRALQDSDRGLGKIVVNETLARRHLGHGSAVGRFVDGRTPLEVVGVARDAFDVALDLPPEPTYFQLLERPGGDCVGACENKVNYLLRLESNRSTIGSLAARAVATANRDAIVVDASFIEERLWDSVRRRSFASLALGLFAIAGIGVCTAGLVGVVAANVTRRTREIAVRRAIGAPARDIARLLLLEAVSAMMVGTATGAAAGAISSRTLAALLYGVRSGDPLTLGAVAVAVVTTATAATLFPLRRALRISPLMALKNV